MILKLLIVGEPLAVGEPLVAVLVVVAIVLLLLLPKIDPDLTIVVVEQSPVITYVDLVTITVGVGSLKFSFFFYS